MYINTKLLDEKNLTDTHFIVLLLIKQNKIEDVSKRLSMYEFFIEQLKEYTENIKSVKHPLKSLRLNKKGQDLLENLCTPEITKDDITLFEWIKGIYLKNGKELGNQKRTKMYIAQFAKESGIQKNNLAFLIKKFIEDEKEFMYSQKLQYLFFKGENVFATKFDLHSSRLYQYYLKHQQYFDHNFKEK